MKTTNHNAHKEDSNIPMKGVMFLGGHPNLVKKLQQIYPKWDFISDEQMRRKASFTQGIIFYWTGHGSHKLMNYVYSRTSDTAKVLYVTATNLPLLLSEMSVAYNAVAAS